MEIHFKNGVYQIEFKTQQYYLIHSLLKPRIIPGGSTDEYYKSIYFKANSVKTLRQCQSLSILEVTKLIKSLATQLADLTQHHHTILGYNPDDILVINNSAFAFVGSDLITKFDTETHLTTICYPFSSKDFFLSPELLNVKELPHYTHYKIAYFSLGLLALYVLIGESFYNKYITIASTEFNTNSLLKLLYNHPIRESKLFWFLSRCLVKEPNNRTILFL